jgi:hypothetical protein
VSTRFESDIPSVGEAILREVFPLLTDEEKAIVELQAYSGERVACLCRNIDVGQIAPIGDDYSVIHVGRTQTKARYAHLTVVPRRVADKALHIAEVTGRRTLFPNYQYIWKGITWTAVQKAGVALTSRHLRNRFRHLARKTEIPEGHWAFLMGGDAEPSMGGWTPSQPRGRWRRGVDIPRPVTE